MRGPRSALSREPRPELGLGGGSKSNILDFSDYDPVCWTDESANHWPSHR
jgi:hypothetical protein